MAQQHTVTRAIVATLAITASTLSWAGADVPADNGIDRHTVVSLSDSSRARAFERFGRLSSVYGRPMRQGATAQASADAFVRDEVETLFGVPAKDLWPGVLYADGAHTAGIMYDHDTGTYKAHVHRYTQIVDGIPVYGSELKMLVRNEPGFPVVLANSTLHDLGDFRVADGAVDQVNAAQALVVAVRELGPGAVVLEGPTPIIWAGDYDDVDVPTFGARVVASDGSPVTPNYQKYTYIFEPATGRVLHRVNEVHNADVTGNVSGWATEGLGADICHDQVVTPLPYARVNIGGTSAFADANGDFVIPNAGSDPVTVESAIRGPWFRVSNAAGPNSLLQQDVTPPGPADFVHNDAGEKFTTAEVNCYLHANIVRDYVLGLDPGVPINDSEFQVNVNVSGSCNAFYNGGSINFFRAGGNCPNEGFSIVVYHEYGHHIVARLTGAQCQWGEGNSDVTGVQVSDTPENAFGFGGDCDVPLRNAENDCEYRATGCSTCGGPCHGCGQLISGCVWDLRNNLLATEPDDYRTIGGQLWLASLVMHIGTGITPQDTINYLMADDDDANLENGTPHYVEIDEAFSRHNMAPPPLLLLTFDFPDGAPTLVSPQGDQTVQLAVSSAVANPVPDSGVLYFDDGSGGTVVEVPMVEIEPNLYEGTFPASSCGNTLRYFFSVETDLGFTMFHPIGAPAPGSAFTAISAIGRVVAFEDDFESDLGWTVETTASAGDWVREVPLDCPDRGAPDVDADGSGSCYLTDNDPNCIRDVNFGSTVLTSPALDATDPGATIAYWRWYDTSFAANHDDDLVVEVSDDDGANWTTLEIVDGDGDDAEGGWIFVTRRIGDFVGSTDQFRVRFTASDANPQSINEAAIDAVAILNLTCGNGCPEDLNGNGSVDFQDILAILNAWGSAGGPEDLDGSGTVDFQDILLVLGAWGPCA